MILAHHVIFGAYGFWLPNDPRGSWSEFVGSYELYQFGGASKTTERRSVAHRPHDRGLRLAAKEALERPAVRFDARQIEAVGAGIETYVTKSKLPVWACAVMPDHVHIVIANTVMSVEQRVIQLKGSATETLCDRLIHPFQQDLPPSARPPKCFARGEWKVFLNTDEDVERAIRYVENNPLKEGLPRQFWKFISPWRQ